MVLYPEQEQTARAFPPAGEAQRGKPQLVPDGNLSEALNAYFSRGSASRRPYAVRLNQHAVGASGWRLTREAIIPASDANRFDSANSPSYSFTWEFWFKNDWEFPSSGDVRIPVLAKQSRLALAAGYTGTTMNRFEDAPFVLNLARLSGTWTWELYATHNHPNPPTRLTAPYYHGVRQHVAVSWNESGNLELTVATEDGTSTTSSASIGPSGRLQENKMAWRMTGPAATANNPEDPPSFTIECLRLWGKARTASEIAADRNRVLEDGTSGLIAQWTGDTGSRDYLEPKGAHMPMFFTGGFPSTYKRTQGWKGVELAANNSTTRLRHLYQNIEASGSVDYLQDAYANAIDDSLPALDSAIAARQYCVRIALRFLGMDSWYRTIETTYEAQGIMTGQFEIAYNAETNTLSAYDAAAPSSVVNVPLVTPGPEPGERVVVTVERDGANLYVDMGTYGSGSSGTLGTATTTTKSNRYGYDTGFDQRPGQVLIEEIAWFYGKPQNAAGDDLTIGDMGWKDSIHRGVTGNDIVDAIDDYEVTNGSTTVVVPSASTTPRVGDFLVATGNRTRNIAYRVTAVASPNVTIDHAYVGASGTVRMAVTRCLYYWKAGKANWDTSFHDSSTTKGPSRYGKRAYLPTSANDEQRVLRPMLLANGCNWPSIGSVREQVELERMKRTAGWALSDDHPCLGLQRYTREGDIDALLGVWGTTLYWLDDRWRKSSDETPIIGLFSHEGDRLSPASGKGFGAFEGSDETFYFHARILPQNVSGKRVLLDWSDDDTTGRVRIWCQDGALYARVFYDQSGTPASAQLYTKDAVLAPGQLAEVAIKLVWGPSSGGTDSKFAINGVVVPHVVDGLWPVTANAKLAPSDSNQSLLGPATDATRAAGYSSFVGEVRRCLVSNAEEFSVSGSSRPDEPYGTMPASASLVLELDEKKGHLLHNTTAASGYSNLVNQGRVPVPVAEDLAPGNENTVWSMDVIRGRLFAASTAGRQVWAEWTGDFETDANGWKSGTAGFLAPKTSLRITEDAGAGAASGIQANSTYRFAVVFYDPATDRRSAPGPVQTFKTGGTAFPLKLEDIPNSEDQRASRVELYASASDGGALYRVATLRAKTKSYVFDQDDITITSGLPIDFQRDVPPRARLLKAVGGRLYWAGVQGNEAAIAFSDSGDEELWRPLDILQVDGNSWSPITAIGGQRGAVHAYTRDSIFRIGDGGGGILTFQKALAVTGTGCGVTEGLIDVGGIEVFPGLNGIWAFDGGRTVPLGQPIERRILGAPGLGKGTDPQQRRAPAAWSPRDQVGIWALRPLGGSGRADEAVVLSGAVQDAEWSTWRLNDVSEATWAYDLDGAPRLFWADSWGYVWRMTAPSDNNELAVDGDGLGDTLENGSTRTIEGQLGTDDLLGAAVGDGLRGIPLLELTKDGTGKVTSWALNRLKATPAATTPASSELESPLQASTTHWVLGGFPVRITTGWWPAGAYEIPKLGIAIDVAFTPRAGEKLLFEWYGTDRDRTPMWEDWDDGDAKKQSVFVDASDGTVSLEPQTDPAWRAVRVRFTYFGTKPLDFHEWALRWRPEGGAVGTQYGTV